MPAATFHFTDNQRCEQGATFSRQFTIYANLTDAEKYGIANDTLTNSQETAIAAKLRNLTGSTARMHIRSTIDAGSTLATLTTENGGLTLGGTAGTVAITISATATAAYTPATYWYDLEIITGSTVERLLQGRFEVDPEVTR